MPAEDEQLQQIEHLNVLLSYWNCSDFTKALSYAWWSAKSGSWSSASENSEHFPNQTILLPSFVLSACEQAVKRSDSIGTWVKELTDHRASDGLLIHQDEKPESISPEIKDHRHHILRACLFCAEAIAKQGHAPSGTLPENVIPIIVENSRNLPDGRTLPPLSRGFIQSLLQRLWPKELQSSFLPAVKPFLLPALLVNTANSNGVVGRLSLERLPNGSGQFFPSFEMALTFRDKDFMASKRNCLAALKALGIWDETVDIRWHLTIPNANNQHVLPPRLTGNSLGGLFTLGAAKLLGSTAPWTNLDLIGISVTAVIADDGTLSGVGGILPKLAQAAREKSFPRITTVVVFSPQLSDLSEGKNALPGLRFVDANNHTLKVGSDEFHMLGAENLLQMAERLNEERRTRWHLEVNTLPELPDDYVQRVALDRELARRIVPEKSGCIVVVGEAGRGKTAFLTAHIHRQLEVDERPIYRFIGYQTVVTAETLAESLYHQLRRKYAIPETEKLTKQSTNSERLRTVLMEILPSKLRTRPDGTKIPEVLYIEAADQLPPTEKLLTGLADLDVLKTPNIYFLITTRQHFNFLTTDECVSFIPFEEFTDDRTDTRAYLKKANNTLKPQLSEALIDAITSPPSDPYFLTVVERLKSLRRDENYPASVEELADLRTSASPWVMTPDKMARDMAVKLNARCVARPNPIEENDIWFVLGLVATAREPLSGKMLGDLVNFAYFAPDSYITDVRQTQREEDEVEEMKRLKRVASSALAKVLELGGNFFKRRDWRGQKDEPYVFAYPSYFRLVTELLLMKGSDRPQKCHRLLAEGCLTLWQKRSNDKTWKYALLNAPQHLIAARRHQQVRELLLDFDYLQARIGATDCVDKPADGTPADVKSGEYQSDKANRGALDDVHGLLRDFDDAIAADPGDDEAA